MMKIVVLSISLVGCAAQSLGVDASPADVDVVIVDADAVTVTDACSLQHPQCTRHSDCDDRLFCNGIERCIDGCCRNGLAPICAVSASCVTAVCDTAMDQCIYTRHHDQCNTGERCTTSSGCVVPVSINCFEGGNSTCEQTLGDTDCAGRFTCNASTSRCEGTCN